MPLPEIDNITLRLNATRTKIMNRGDLADQVYVQNYFFDALQKLDAIKVGEYGKGAEFDLLTEGNTTAKWMNRYEKYNTTPGTETRAAIFELRKLGDTAVADKDTINENDSDEKVWDFVAEKTNDSMSAIAQTLETGLHNTGTDVKAILGLRASIADDPTTNPTAYNYGGLSRATNTYWRNQYNTSAGLGATVNFSVDGRAAMRDMFMTCLRNAPKTVAGKKKETTLLYMPWEVRNLFESILDSNDAHTRSDKMASMGFDDLVYRYNIPVVWGDDANINGRIYFINTNKDSKGNPFFGFYIDSRSNFSLGEWMKVPDQPIYVQQIDVRGFIGGPYIKNQGVMFGIS